MKTSPFPLGMLVLTVLLAGCGKPAQAPPDAAGTAPGRAISAGDPAPARNTSFAAVTSQLDAGGTVFGYVATDQWLAGLSTNVAQFRELLLTLPEVSSRDRENLNQAFALFSDSIARSGIEQLTGVGLSGVQISPELYRTKLILHHDRGQGAGLFWNFLGGQPHSLAGLDLLPKQTALAAFGDLDVPAVWEAIETEFATVPELAQGLKKWQLEFERNTSLTWPEVLQSLGGELGVIFTLDEEKPVDVPFVAGLQIPEPGLLFALKVKNDLLYDRITSELKEKALVQITAEKDLKMCALPIPLPLPVALEITVARAGDYLFLASHSQLVRRALAARDQPATGLRATPEFAALKQHLPARGNQFIYADKKFSATLLKLRSRLMDTAHLKPEQAQLLQKLFLPAEPTYGLSIGAHTATGWQTVAVGNQDSSVAVVGAAAVLPVGVLAGIAVPNFVKARDAAQKNACRHQLDLIKVAKQEWAQQQNQPANATPTELDLAAHLPDGKLPRCPDGGRYTIGRVSAAPKCSQPGHNLNN